MKTATDTDLLVAYLYDELSAENRARVEERLDAEPALLAELEGLRLTREVYGELGDVEVPARIRQNVVRAARLAAGDPEKRRRSWLSQPAFAMAAAVLIVGAGAALSLKIMHVPWDQGPPALVVASVDEFTVESPEEEQATERTADKPAEVATAVPALRNEEADERERELPDEPAPRLRDEERVRAEARGGNDRSTAPIERGPQRQSSPDRAENSGASALRTLGGGAPSRAQTNSPRATPETNPNRGPSAARVEGLRRGAAAPQLGTPGATNTMMEQAPAAPLDAVATGQSGLSDREMGAAFARATPEPEPPMEAASLAPNMDDAELAADLDLMESEEELAAPRREGRSRRVNRGGDARAPAPASAAAPELDEYAERGDAEAGTYGEPASRAGAAGLEGSTGEGALLFERGRDAYARGDDARAVRELEAYLETGAPTRRAEAFFYLGASHFRQGDRVRAQSALAASLDADPAHPRAADARELLELLREPRELYNRSATEGD